MKNTTNKTIQTNLNYFQVIRVVALLMFLVIYTLGFTYMMYLIFIMEIKHDSTAFLCFIPTALFTLITIFAFRKVARSINYVKVNDDGIRMMYPLKFKSILLEWDQIKGYSRSDYIYGGRMNLRSKSVIVYLKSGEKHEIIKRYNSGFENFQNQLKKFNIIAFGYEGFVTKTDKLILVKRVYKYDQIGLNTSKKN